MPNVLIRNVPESDLELVRGAAVSRGESLQEYLLETLLARAAYVRRQEALARAKRRLEGSPPLSDADRRAAFDAFDADVERKVRESVHRSER